MLLAQVSVIIPTFRRPVPLAEAIASALAQEDVSVDVLVLDDSPEGSARSVVDALNDDRVRYQPSITPSGGRPSLVRNQGWPQTQGAYLHFLDDDDRVPPGTYAAALHALQDCPRAGVVFGRVEPFGDDPGVLQQEQSYFANAARRAHFCHRLRSRHLVALHMLFKNTLLVNSACLIRRDCVAPLGGYDPDVRLVEDVDFYCRAIRRFGYVFLDRTVLHYRTGAPSLMHSRENDEAIAKSYQRMHARYRSEWGIGEWFALKMLARTALRWQ